MSPARELRRELPSWKEQTGSSQGPLFYTAGGRAGADKGTVQYLLRPGTQASSTLHANFSTTTVGLAVPGLVTLQNFDFRAPSPEDLGSSFVAEWLPEWPIPPTQWERAEFGQMLNTILWLRDCETSTGEEQYLSKGVLLSEEILQFCSQHRIFGYLQRSIKLVRECFLSIQDVYVEKEQDPETEDEWLVLSTEIEEDIESVLNSYENYTRRYVTLVPWPERNKIRFSYNLT